MKKFVFVLLLVSLFIGFNSCKKESTNTNNPVPPVVNTDPYNFTVSNTKEAFVLLTTATWCHYCWEWGIPAFEVAFAGQESIDKNKVNGCALHYSYSDPMYLAMADTIKNRFNIGGPPNLWIECDNTNNLNPTGWKNQVKSKQTGTSVCGVALNKVKSGSTYKVYVKVKFFTPQTGIYNLAVYATENGKVSTQTTNSGTNPNFIHNEIFRGEISNNTPWGTQLFSGSSQTDYKFTYTYTPAAGVNINNIKFVGVIYRMSAGKPVETPNSNTY